MNTDYLFDNTDFCEMWKIFNEYLLEDHGITLDDEGIKKRLTKLDQLCKGDAKKAARIVEVMIVRGETVIFMPNDNEF